MMPKTLADVIRRAGDWPEEVQEELLEVALEIEAGLSGGVYHATPEELQGIDRGLKAANEGRFASDDAVAAVFAKRRHAGR
jgi:predicted transcriptional regulator